MRRVLFLQGPSILVNPSLDQGLVDAAFADDAEAARSEWGGQFRSDISEYLPDALLDAAIVQRRTELPWMVDFRHCYVAFCDPSGGAHDAMTMAIAHRDPRTQKLVLDQVHVEQPPFDPDELTRRFAAVLQRFEIRHLVGDRYGMTWVEAAFRRTAIRYEHSQLDKSAIYNESLALFSQRRVELLDHPKLITELRLLERRPRAGGRADAIDHPSRGGRDDIANSVCGALWLASVSRAIPQGIGARIRPAYSIT
jgi:hypothetical protein